MDIYVINACIVSCSIFIIVFVVFRSTYRDVQDLYLTIQSGITLGNACEPYEMLGLKFGLVTCKANDLSTVLSLWPLDLQIRIMVVNIRTC